MRRLRDQDGLKSDNPDRLTKWNNGQPRWNYSALQRRVQEMTYEYRLAIEEAAAKAALRNFLDGNEGAIRPSVATIISREGVVYWDVINENGELEERPFREWISEWSSSAKNLVGPSRRALPPPRRAQSLLYFALPRAERGYIIGDLDEEFQTIILPMFGPRMARLWYWSQVVRSLGRIFLASLKKVVRLGVLLRISDWISKINGS